jgi:hypothetical protein
MSILTQLNKLNITNKELVNLTEKEIIRIEKKLKAEVKMGGSLDINEVNSIIKLLKENKDELHLFLDDKFSWFREIVTHPDELIVFPMTHAGLFKLDDELKDFVSDNFQTELTKYSALCLYKNHYRALNSFLAYNPVIPDRIMEDIQLKMSQKLEYGIECIEIDVNELEKKIVHLFNPFFFRCINFLENIHFEDLMNELTNSLVENLKKNKQLVRALFSVGAFKSSDRELKSVISQNRNYAIDRGVGELSNFKKYPKGGTTSKKLIGNADFNARNLLWIVIVIIIFVGKIGSTCNDNNSPKIDMSQKLIEIMERREGIFDFDEIRNDIAKSQRLEEGIYNENSVDFNESNLHFDFRDGLSVETNLSVLINNKSKKPLVFVFQSSSGVRYYCIQPNSIRMTKDYISKFFIYSGKNPIEYYKTDYIKGNNKGFKFNDFDKNDMNNLITIHDFSDFKKSKKTIEIIITEDDVKINKKQNLY